MNDRKHICNCLEANDGWCPKHGRITRDPDELLHDAKMMEEEMKEQTGRSNCSRCNAWVEDLNAHRCGVTDQELEEIRGRLEGHGAGGVFVNGNDLSTYDGAYAHLCQHGGLGGDKLALIAMLWRGASANAALLAEVERLKGFLTKIKDECGDVCDEFETCRHKSCGQSAHAHIVASEALRALGVEVE